MSTGPDLEITRSGSIWEAAKDGDLDRVAECLKSGAFTANDRDEGVGASPNLPSCSDRVYAISCPRTSLRSIGSLKFTFVQLDSWLIRLPDL